ncbi:hypothetical protein GTY54_29025 [Streptomyces sp. SID625]|nr:hypothetical protein [Streptomyces sp. SID625]
MLKDKTPKLYGIPAVVGIISYPDENKVYVGTPGEVQYGLEQIIGRKQIQEQWENLISGELVTYENGSKVQILPNVKLFVSDI